MEFNPLIDGLPTNWRGVEINTDFRQVLRFYRVMQAEELSEFEKAVIVLKLFFEDELKGINAKEAWGFIGYFVSAGDDKKQAIGKKVFDFEADSGRIFAAFLQVYQIDLSVKKIHWWIFLELFHSLPEDTMLMRVIDIRGRKPPKGSDREYLAALRKAQAAYKIGNEDNETAVFDFLLGAAT
jgi:hypothetical protein